MNVLYLFFATGCGACEAAKPHLEAWRKRHGYKPTVVQLNVGLKDWEVAGFKPEATPTYLITSNSQPVAKFEGALDTDQLDKWYTSALDGNPIEPQYETDATEPDDESHEDEPPKRKPRKKKKGHK